VKKIRLSRSIALGRENEVIVVSDAVAKTLFKSPSLGSPPTAILVEDMGADAPVQPPVRVRLLRPVSVNGGPQSAGAVVAVSERDAKLLASLNKAEIIGTLPEVAVPDGDQVQDAELDRGPLVRPLGRRESAK
jgi:hypothetical protein